MTIVAPSRWMAKRAKASSLLKEVDAEIIPNGIDVTRYMPASQSVARDRLGLSRNRRLIMFGARHALSDRNKGFDLLAAAINRLPSKLRADSTLVLFGESIRTRLPAFNMQCINCGEINDEDHIAELYRAADILVVPSREENLPNMISEAMACGLPCVAFDVGGIADQIIHRQTGCLVSPFDTAALAAEMTWLLENSASRSSCAERARGHAVENFSLDLVAHRHLAVYRRLFET